MQKEIAGETTTAYRHEQPPSTGECGGPSTGEGSTRDSESRGPPSTRRSEPPGDGPSSPTQEAAAIPPPGRSKEAERSPTASSEGGATDEQLSVAGGPKTTNIREPSPYTGTGGSETATNDQGGREVMSDSPVAVAKLHLALESSARPGGTEQAGRLDFSECARFCAEWSRDRQLPAFFDRSLLEHAWSVAEQVSFTRKGNAYGF